MATPTPLRTPAEDTLLKRFPAEKSALPGAAAERDAAFASVAAAGLPHRRVEAWKYTDLRTNLRSIAPAAGPADLGSVRRLAPAIPGDGARRIVVANGQLSTVLSDLGNLEPGLTITSLATALAAGDKEVLAALGQSLEAAGNYAVDLNTAFMSDGVVIWVDAGTAIHRPIEIAHVTDSATPAATAVRNVVFLGDGASATLIETIESTHAVPSQSNIVTALSLGDGASLSHVRLQLEPFDAFSLSTLTAEVGKGAKVSTFNAALGAGLARAQVFARFRGNGASGKFAGVTLLNGRRHADTTLVVTHDAEGCDSRELYKAVIDDDARSVFQGRIVVPSHAQKTDARMMTASLLLSEGAEADAKPELEIFADDVQCGHGATAGALDDDLLFYLLARGIPKVEAETMLILAFLGEAIDMVENEVVHDALIARVENWLRARN